MATPSKASTSKGPTVDIDLRLTQLDQKLEAVRHLYDRYFSGLLKIEPAKEHRELKAMMTGISTADIKSTATKFRHQTIQSRYLQHLKMWTKTLREIEEGTHKRELFLLEKKEEFKRLTNEQPRPEFAAALKQQDDAQDKYLSSLYDRLTSAVGESKPFPSKDIFVKKIGSQILDLKKKNPDKRVEIRLQKNTQGKLEVKIKLQPKT